jgi:transcriptional regulator with XRE-family HTH domain
VTPTIRFGSNLRHLRKDLELSQEELGFRAGLHRTEISLLERGERAPGLDTLAKLSDALEAPITSLLDEIGWQGDSEPVAAVAAP